MVYLGIDLGTSYFKAGIFDAEGKMKGFGRFAVPKLQEEKLSRLSHRNFIDTIKLCVDTALQNASLSASEIVSISYGSQANSFILLNKEEKELTPFILWNDEQADMMPEVQSFTQKATFAETTGIGIDVSNQFLINKLKWIQATDPALWQQVHYVLTMPDYLCFKLTGQRVVDASTASLTGLLDYKKNDWWQQATTIVGIEKSMLSDVVPLGLNVGIIEDSNNFLGLNNGTVFCTGGLDHHVAAIGAGVGKFFDISESTGTVIAAVSHGKDCSVNDGICVASGLSNGHYFKMAFHENGAVALEWYQKTYRKELSIDELTKMAQDVPDGCDGLVALPCVNNFIGLEGFVNKKDYYHHGYFVRAIMESTAKSLGQLFEELQLNSHARIVSTGGGAKSLLWRKIKSSITGYNLSTPIYSEAACIGAAMVAAKGYGAFKDIFDVQSTWFES